MQLWYIKLYDNIPDALKEFSQKTAVVRNRNSAKTIKAR